MVYILRRFLGGFLAHFLCIFVAFRLFLVTFGGLGRSSGTERKKGRLQGAVLWKIGYLFGDHFGHLFGIFFFGGLRDTKKGGPGGPSKLDPFFGHI